MEKSVMLGDMIAGLGIGNWGVREGVKEKGR